jgi:ankyrin repeat protein
MAELLNTVKEGRGKAAIHFAAARGDLSIFKFLHSKGADTKQLDGSGGRDVHVIKTKEIHHFLCQ